MLFRNGSLVSSGLNDPNRVAVDSAGNLYIADTGDNAIKELPYAFVDPTARWESAAAGTDALPAVLPATENLSGPFAPTSDQSWLTITGITNGVVNFAFSSTPSNRIGHITLLGQVIPIMQGTFLYVLGTNQLAEWSQAGSDSVVLTVIPQTATWTASANATWLHLSVANQSGTGSTNVVFSFDANPGPIRSGTLTVAGLTLTVTQASATLRVNSLLEGANAGSDSVFLAMNPVMTPWTATANANWLHLSPAYQSGAYSTNMVFSFDANPGPTRSGTLTIAGQTLTVTQSAGAFSLGTAARLEGPSAGSDSVVLAVTPASAAWAATANAPWLHLSAANQSGTGSTNVVFSYDANPGATRSDTFTIAGQTLTVTQAGSTYVAAGAVTALVSSGLGQPNDVAVDASGNVYIADFDNNALYEWTAAGNTVILLASGLGQADGVAVDAAGNVYVADYGDNTIKEWTAANSNVTTLVSSGLNHPEAVAVDVAGNLYIADAGNNAIKECSAANSAVTTLVSTGLSSPAGVAVDAAGNVYIADYGNNAIKEWTAANSIVSVLVSSGLSAPVGVAVDGAGNVYIGDSANQEIKKWSVASNTVTTLVSSGLNGPFGVAVDGVGNIYLADTGNKAVKELPFAFVDPTPRSERAAAGNDALPVVLPATENLSGPFALTSDQPWLSISGITNGVPGFSFAVNTGPARVANINLLGQTIPVTQYGVIFGLSYGLATDTRLEGPAAGSDSVVLEVSLPTAAWTATADASWLHLSPANQSGAGSANIVFSFDANLGATHSGTLTIAGQPFTVTQAGATYVAAGTLTTLLSSGLNYPQGVAVDDSGNVYIADTDNNAIKKWTVADGSVATLVASGLNRPQGVALDAAGNVYIADTLNGSIKQWPVASGNVTTLVSSGLNFPAGLAVDNVSNVYIADTYNSAIKEWSIINGSVIGLISSGLDFPQGVAADFAGNLYFSDTGNRALKEFTLASNALTTLASSDLNYLTGVAVDAAGNVCMADAGNLKIEKWTAASNSVTVMVSAGLSQPMGVALDGAGNLYIADAADNAIKELPYTFVDPTARVEGPAAGNDSLPGVLPGSVNLLSPFAPTSDQSWLTITGVNYGVVSFSFSDNLSPSRTAHITLLGQVIPIIQSPPIFTLATNLLSEGPAAGIDVVVLTVVPATAPWTATANAGWLRLSVTNQSGTGSFYVSFTFDNNPGAPRTGTLTIAGQTLAVTQAGPAYSLGNNALFEGANSGSDSVMLNVNPAFGVWTASANAAWLHLTAANQSGAGSTNVVFSFDQNPGVARIGTLAIAGQTLTVTQAGPAYSLGTNALFEGANAGSDSVMLNVNPAFGVWTASANAAWLHLTAANQSGAGSTNVVFSFDQNPGVARIGTLAIAGQTLTVTQAGPVYSLGTNALFEDANAGSDSVMLNVNPTFGVWTASANAAWLHLTAANQSGAGSTNVVFSFDANPGLMRVGTLTIAGQTLTVTQAAATYLLGLADQWEGPGSGNDSVVLAVNSGFNNWTATANAAWLHLSPANQSGTNSTNVIFSYDANPGATRSGTFTIAGQTLTVTQAGSTYVAAGAVTVLVSSGLGQPNGVAVDAADNVYIADFDNNALYEWTAVNNTMTTLASGLGQADGVAVDAAGNVYVASYGDNTIKEWTAANSNVTTLVSSGLNHPEAVAVDSAGNVYIADAGNNAIKECLAADNTVSTLVSSGLSSPAGVAVDAAGNVYIADYGNNAIKEWTAASSTVSTLVSSGLSAPVGVAVDGAGNVYIGDSANQEIKKWSVAGNTVTTLVSSGLNGPFGVAVDGVGNIYLADTGNKAVKELPRAFVDPTPKSESLAAGNDALLGVLPGTENLFAPFTPTSDQAWLTIAGVTNGVVGFSFTADSGASRGGHITLLGQTIDVTQGSVTYSLGTPALLAGPLAASDSVVLGVTPATGNWTATTIAAWLHLSPANQSGAGSTNVVFSYDANPGATRTGTLSVSGQTLTVMQAGSTYVAAGVPTTLSSMEWSAPIGVAVDRAGNVYYADAYYNAINKWSASNNFVTWLITAGLKAPQGVAVDSVGNIYIADTGNAAIKELPFASSQVMTLVPSVYYNPQGLALDGAGNVYFTDGNTYVQEWTAFNSNLTTLSSGLGWPQGVTVDAAGNVYVADRYYNRVDEWTAANKTLTSLVASGLNSPYGVAVDGAGNVYIGDSDDNAIKKWTAANRNVTTLVSSGLSGPGGVAVDGAGNIYISDFYNNAIKELPYAFVDATPRVESEAAGSDSLPVVLPATENLLAPFAPTSDQSWLTITGVTNGVVSFSFAPNTGASRTAHITVLGQAVPITQGVIGTPPTLTGAQMLGNGVIQFAFTNTPGAAFTVVSTTNLSFPMSNWTVVGAPSNTAPGVFIFTSQPTTNDAQRFYGVRSP